MNRSRRILIVSVTVLAFLVTAPAIAYYFINKDSVTSSANIQTLFDLHADTSTSTEEQGATSATSTIPFVKVTSLAADGRFIDNKPITIDWGGVPSTSYVTLWLYNQGTSLGPRGDYMITQNTGSTTWTIDAGKIGYFAIMVQGDDGSSAVSKVFPLLPPQSATNLVPSIRSIDTPVYSCDNDGYAAITTTIHGKDFVPSSNVYFNSGETYWSQQIQPTISTDGTSIVIEVPVDSPDSFPTPPSDVAAIVTNGPDQISNEAHFTSLDTRHLSGKCEDAHARG